MRNEEINLAGRKVKLARTFKALSRITEEAVDPMALMDEAQAEALAAREGREHTPRIRLTTDLMAKVLQIGAEEAGEEITPEEMQDAIFETGAYIVRDVTLGYLYIMVTPPNIKELVEGKKADKSAGK